MFETGLKPFNPFKPFKHFGFPENPWVTPLRAWFKHFQTFPNISKHLLEAVVWEVPIWPPTGYTNDVFGLYIYILASAFTLVQEHLSAFAWFGDILHVFFHPVFPGHIFRTRLGNGPKISPFRDSVIGSGYFVLPPVLTGPQSIIPILFVVKCYMYCSPMLSASKVNSLSLAFIDLPFGSVMMTPKLPPSSEIIQVFVGLKLRRACVGGRPRMLAPSAHGFAWRSAATLLSAWCADVT